MQDAEAIWAEAAAGIQADMDADVRAEAFEAYMVEAARMRMQDCRGTARIVLRSGQVLVGELVGVGPAPVEGMLELREDGGRGLLVRIESVVLLTGPTATLRDETGEGRRPTLASWLREVWLIGAPVRALLADGRWVSGDVIRVGADHLALAIGPTETMIPFRAVEAWILP